jgi:hypothetical protein
MASGVGRGFSLRARSLAILAGAAMAQFMLGSSNTKTVSAESDPDEFDAGTDGGLIVDDGSCLPSNGCQLD